MKIKEMVNDFRLRAKDAGEDRVALKESYNTSATLLRDTIKEHKIDCKKFSIKELFTECFGKGTLDQCKSMNEIDFTELRESAGAVSTAAFQNISGQITYGMVLEKYESPEFVVTQTIPEYTGSRTQGLEKVGQITQIGDETGTVPEGTDYPLAGVSENWIYLNEPRKKGMIVPLTKEAIFYDRVGQLVSNAGDVGFSYGLQLEKAAVDCLTDENTSATNAAVDAFKYNWRGTIIDAYGDNSGNHTWDNLQASNALVDWTDVENAWNLFKLMLDPFTGEPMLIRPTHLFVPTTLEWTARRIVNATSIRVATPGFATSANPTQTEVSNPVASLGLQIVSTPYMDFRMATDTSWYLTNPSRGLVRNVHFPMEVTQAPMGNSDEFNRDIVMKFKVSGKQGFQWKDPRASVKNTA